MSEQAQSANDVRLMIEKIAKSLVDSPDQVIVEQYEDAGEQEQLGHGCQGVGMVVGHRGDGGHGVGQRRREDQQPHHDRRARAGTRRALDRDERGWLPGARCLGARPRAQRAGARVRDRGRGQLGRRPV